MFPLTLQVKRNSTRYPEILMYYLMLSFCSFKELEILLFHIYTKYSVLNLKEQGIVRFLYCID
jgi:hypothetical protein